MLPSRSSDLATQSPSLRRASLAIARGIRTARLFPHFETVVSFRICIYFEYTSDPLAIQAGDAQVPHLAVSHANRGCVPWPPVAIVVVKSRSEKFRANPAPLGESQIGRAHV